MQKKRTKKTIPKPRWEVLTCRVPTAMKQSAERYIREHNLHNAAQLSMNGLLVSGLIKTIESKQTGA